MKTDEYTMWHFNPIKYCQISHFASVLGWVGLAVAWKVASQPGYGLSISATVFQVCCCTHPCAEFVCHTYDDQ